MVVYRASSTVVLAVLALSIGGCASEFRSERPLTGVEADIESTVLTVKASGARQLMGSRAIRLPLRTLESIAAYAYQYPEACGSHFFRVLESGGTRILEYSHLRPTDGMVFVIRDYVVGPHPFIGPGLWTSYDHTSMDIPTMMAEFVETKTGVTPRVYSRGLVTGLAAMTQDELDFAYRSALRAASECPMTRPG